MRVRVLCLGLVGVFLTACSPERTGESLAEVHSLYLGIGDASSLVWQPVDSERPRAPELVASENGIEFRLSGFYLGSRRVAGRDYARVLLPGHGPLTRAGYPELPRVRANLIIPHRARVEFEVTDSKSYRIPIDPPLPSRGDITRDVDPARVPYRPGVFYRSGKQYPQRVAFAEEPFILRDYRGLTIQFQPFVYDRTDGVLTVYTRIRARFAGSQALRLDSTRRESPEFAGLYQSTFLNYPGGVRYDAIEEPGRLLIITPDVYHDAVLPLRDWKIERGLPASVVRLSGIGSTAGEIKAFIQEEYQSPGSLTYVILVGDSDSMPTLVGGYEGAHSDPSYAMVAGDDFYADLFISRISARNLTQVETQVAKFIGYERDPQPQAAWYTRGIGIASDEGSPSDWERADGLRDSLLGYGYSEVAQIYDPGATASQVVTQVDRGASIINYIGHGSGTGWMTSSMDTMDVAALSNRDMLPFIVDVSCMNGSFVNHETCFAEAWLRAGSPGETAGAVAMFSASTNASWVPPCLMQSWIVDELLVNELRTTAGGMYFGGAMKVLDQYGNDEGRKLVEQYNLFGDASLMVRTRTPAAIQVQHPDSLEEAGYLTVTVEYPDGTPVSGATVALSDGRVMASGQTAEDGSITLAYDGAGPDPATLVVTGHNLVTYRANLPVGGVVPNDPPVADAGVDQSVVAGEQVTLTGLDSFDPDGDELTFSWSQTEGPLVTLSGTGQAQPWFMAPLVGEPVVLTFRLVVDDGLSESPPDQVSITVSPPVPGWDLVAAAADTPLAIPDNDAYGIQSQLPLDGGQAIAEMEVELAISHTYIGDLRVRLVCPDGSLVILHDRSGGSANDIHQVYPVSGCNGQLADRTLALLVSDHARIDVGTLDFWEVRMNFADPPAWDIDQAAADTPMGIPDDDPSGIASDIWVGGLGVIAAMEIEVDIRHTWIGDLQVWIECPGGGGAVLHDRIGGSADDLHQVYTVGACRGQAASGTYRLWVRDRARYDLGRLEGWRLKLRME